MYFTVTKSKSVRKRIHTYTQFTLKMTAAMLIEAGGEEMEPYLMALNFLAHLKGSIGQ